jgi:hypothetical protein
MDQDQTRDHADREGATPEAEAEDVIIVVPVIPADEFVGIDDVALQVIAERRTEQCQRLEG